MLGFSKKLRVHPRTTLGQCLATSPYGGGDKASSTPARLDVIKIVILSFVLEVADSVGV